jgi:hypothetical protein
VTFDLEDTLQRSFPNPGDADTIRQIFREALDNDGLGMNARRENGGIRFEYSAAVLVATNR